MSALSRSPIVQRPAQRANGRLDAFCHTPLAQSKEVEERSPDAYLHGLRPGYRSLIAARCDRRPVTLR